MQKSVFNLNRQYGAALFAAPLLCGLYVIATGNFSVDLFWFFSDLKSFFMLIIFFPIIEELAFRGIIQEFLDRKLGLNSTLLFFSLANLITSMLFASMHLIHHTFIWALLTFFPSLVFGYFKDQYRHVIPSIALHMFYNLSYFSIVANPIKSF